MAHFYLYYLVMLFLILYLKRYFHYYSKKKSPPSPLALPIIGHYHLIKDPLHLALASLSSKFGPILSLRVGCKSFLVVSSPSLIKECFTKNDLTFANRPKTMASDHFTFNYALFPWAPYGNYWRTLRRLTALELFSTISLQKSATIREEETQTLVRLLFKASKNGTQKVELDHFISTFMINIMMRQVVGKGYVNEEDAATKTGKNNIEKFGKLFAPTLTKMNACDYFPILKFFGYKGLEKEMIIWQEEKNKFIQDIIDEVRQQLNSTNFMKKEKKETLVETLLSLQESEPDFYTDDLIKSLLLIFFVPGSFLTSMAVSNGMSLLLTHPKELHQLRTEIENIVGNERLLNESDLPKLSYLRCVVNETLRYYTPSPLLFPHYSSEDCVVGGYDIPKGTILWVNARGMHRDSKVWDEPNKFKPDRFQAMEVDREGFKFVPFGMGRRACSGENMALRATSLALGALAQCFDWKIVGEEVTEMAKTPPLEAVCIPRQLQLLSHL